MAGQLKTNAAVNELAALLIPIHQRHILLPNVTVAEIIPYVKPTPVADKPDWFLGMIRWRNTDVPMVSFEKLNAEPFESHSKSRRLVVLNSLVDGDRLPFCAFVAEAMPRLMRVMADEIVAEEALTPGPAEHCRVLVSGEPASIPNVDYLQQQLLQQL